jgi:hypothetical protein
MPYSLKVELCVLTFIVFAESITPPTTSTYSLPDSPFGLDMSFSTPAFNTNIDLSFDQTLGLDLAPGYDYGFSTDNAFNVFGLDMMRDVEMVPRQKKKKVAWVEVNKLIDGELLACLNDV